MVVVDDLKIHRLMGLTQTSFVSGFVKELNEEIELEAMVLMIGVVAEMIVRVRMMMRLPGRARAVGPSRQNGTVCNHPFRIG